MELIAATKMRRAVRAVSASRAYVHGALSILQKLSGSEGAQSHRLFEKRSLKRVAIVLISSNRGLCGGYNSAVANRAMKYIAQELSGVEIHGITLGKKGRDAMLRNKVFVGHDFPKSDLTLSGDSTVTVAHAVVAGFLAGEYDAVYVAFTDFVSSIRTVPTVIPLLPLSRDLLLKKPETSENYEEPGGIDAVFEPDVTGVLDVILPRIVSATLYQCVLEAEASEHSSRMLAMKNASDAAHDYLGSLRMSYNQARQSSITQEIAEISAGRAALE